MSICVKQLWGSWDQDAVVLDRKTNTYADHTKVRPINFVGKYYKCRGPLNTAPSPQGRPTFVQAGGSPRGRQFAAQTADSIIAPSAGIKANKAYRDDVRAHAAAAGRDPDEIKVLFVVAPVLGETEAEAQARFARIQYVADVHREDAGRHQLAITTSTSPSSISTRSCRA